MIGQACLRPKKTPSRVGRGRHCPVLVADAGIVHQHVQPAEITAGPGERILYCLFIRGVERVDDGLRARFLDPGGGCLRALLVDIGANHRRALAGKLQRHGLSDAGASAGDKGNAVLKGGHGYNSLLSGG